MEKCFEFEGVTFAWPGGRSVLDAVSFGLPEGVFAVVRGPSGAGKSTLLRLMNRLEEPQSGVIRYRGRPLAEYAPPFLRRQVAYLQQLPVVPDATVREVLMMPFTYGVNRDIPPPSDSELAARLEEVRLESVSLDERAAALSVGQRQRLCLVRALVAGPEVLLLDEPTASLDRESARVVEHVAEHMCTKGVTVVMVTHDDFTPHGVPAAELRLAAGRVEVCL